MDKNTWIGFLLIAAIIVGFAMLTKNNQPVAEKTPQQTTKPAPTGQQLVSGDATPAEATAPATPQKQNNAFSAASQGESRMVTLENNKVRLFIDTKGGIIRRAELKEYKAYGDSVNDLCLFREKETDLAFILKANGYTPSTAELYFEPQQPNDQNVIMRLKADSADTWIDFVYTLHEDDYMVQFAIVPHNAQKVLAANETAMQMHWHQLVPQQERGRKFEERYAQLQYMFTDGDMDKLSESKEATEQEKDPIRWIAYKDQFFSTVMIADGAFSGSTFRSIPQKETSRYIKEYRTSTYVPFDATGSRVTTFRYYFGPNHYNTLKAYDAGKDSKEKLHLKELVPLGWKIVSWINMILVIPMFDLFTSWGLHIGLVILLMTLVIKLIILPFVFASYKSSAKMRVLKPQLDEINAKYPPEKMQERQKETMALYSRAGVSPMSGCLPMLFQFPVLMAMFWFFPTAIELRGQSFLWAEDLSTYDALITWTTPIPLLGTHLSLFCLLMTAVNIIYTYITMQQQSTDPNMKFMKYMMYAMPLFFLFIFNDYAAGLSYYYFLSLLMTIVQTMIFRLSIDENKLLAEMEANARKKATKQKSGLMARLEAMQKEQQRMARENAKAQQKRYR